MGDAELPEYLRNKMLKSELGSALHETLRFAYAHIPDCVRQAGGYVNKTK